MILPAEGYPFSFGEVRGCFKQRFAIAELPEISPCSLAAPLHRHHNEDEYTYVLQGTVSIVVGDKVVRAGPGYAGYQTARTVAHVLERRTRPVT